MLLKHTTRTSRPAGPLLGALALCLSAAILRAQHQSPSAPPAHQTPSGAKEAVPTTQPAEKEIEPPREPSATDILRELSKDAGAAPRPVVLPSRPGQTVRSTLDPSAAPPNAVAPVVPRLLPDGYRIVDRPGRLTREGDYYTFSFESRGQGPPELPIRLLPNRLLEDMEVFSEGGTKAIVFVVSGEVTEYHGVNYLLIQKLLTRPNLGNLK